MPVLTPLLLCLANAITGIFENARNKKFVKRAGQVLNETEIIRVGVVGSYGKTSVKNIFVALKDVSNAMKSLEEDTIELAKFENINETTKITVLIWLGSLAGEELVGANISFSLQFDKI